MSTGITAADYAKMMIDAQRAAFEAMRTVTPIMNTVGSMPEAAMIDERKVELAAQKIEEVLGKTPAPTNVFEEIDYRRTHKERYESIDRAIPMDVRLKATYTPIVMRELVIWLCSECATILKKSNVQDVKPLARSLKESISDYDKTWQYEYEPDARKSVKWLMRDWIANSLGRQIEMLKESYKYIILNGKGPKYNDANTRDLIAWIYTIDAICSEVIKFDAEMVRTINGYLPDGKSIGLKKRKDDFTYAYKDYADALMDKFGYKTTWTCAGVRNCINVLHTQMRLYDPKSRLDELERLIELEQHVVANKKIVLN